MSRRGWVTRGLLALVASFAAVGAAASSNRDTSPVTIGILGALAVVLLALLLDSLGHDTTVWSTERVSSGTRGRDSLAAAHLRALEDHLSARHPTAAVRDRLAALADGVLRARHGVGIDTPAGRALVDPDVLAVIDGPVARLKVATITRCIERIESL